ncbi:hypothetical protein NIES4075_67650 [Tolypothrix sp. NIES-4075]|nr:hypothetical protein NIES4075_67650 [Tolypothrix sp. NIES-4075]
MMIDSLQDLDAMFSQLTSSFRSEIDELILK